MPSHISCPKCGWVSDLPPSSETFEYCDACHGVFDAKGSYDPPRKREPLKARLGTSERCRLCFRLCAVDKGNVCSRCDESFRQEAEDAHRENMRIGVEW